MLPNETKMKIEILLDKGMVFSAKKLCEKMIETDNSEYLKFQYANILRMCTLFSKSENTFRTIDVERIPEKYRYYYHLYLAHLLMDIGKTEQAKDELKKCMQFEVSDTIPYVYIASLLLGEQDNEEAIDYLTRALDKKGDIDEVYYNLATRFLVRGDLDSAMNAINSCLRLDPEYPNAQVIKEDLIELERMNW